ncbi:MAG TPA: gliding motility lipoprotein GldH [Bacteroidia bacterium]|nr:gliding motility lipoprotein GldH [Bacteroidia bacterium]
MLRAPFYLMVVVCVMLMAACDSNRLFEDNKEIPDHEWYQDKPVVLNAVIEDTSIGYNVYINIRNAGYYRFSNIYLFLNTRMPDGVMQRDTVECTLASPEGKWLGDGLGDIWDNRILFRKDVFFRQKGEYRFELIQAMRIDPLPGIMDAGMRIEKAGTK